MDESAEVTSPLSDGGGSKDNLDAAHGRMVSYIWNIADECLRDAFQRGQYRDVILFFLTLRRIDLLLEESKPAVLDETRPYIVVDSESKQERLPEDYDKQRIFDITGYKFYNVSRYTLQRLKMEVTPQAGQLYDAFITYLNGFSDNITDIVHAFGYYNGMLKRLSDTGRLLPVIQKFTDPSINLSDKDVTLRDGTVLPALTNAGMGYVFEELLRRFNEEMNEGAGEHFTPREIIRLMCMLVFLPVKDKLPPLISVYDPACGTGGMLTQSADYLANELGVQPEADEEGRQVVFPFGVEINAEIYAICKSDMLIGGENLQVDRSSNIRCANTLRDDPFKGVSFDFMLSNPPYGKAWNAERAVLADSAGGVTDDRYVAELETPSGEYVTEKLLPRTSDGQLLFLMDMVSKMQSLDVLPCGSRIATIQNGSSLFTGDAGSGESNIRRYLVERDLVDCIVQLPGNIFYNTGITTYLWLLAGNKSESHKGRIMLIDASRMGSPLRKNLGSKNCEISAASMTAIYRTYERFCDVEPTDDVPLEARVFPADEFRYFRIQVERPLRLRCYYDSRRLDAMSEGVKPGQQKKAEAQHKMLCAALASCPAGFCDDWEEYTATVRRADPLIKEADLAMLRRYCCEVCPTAKPVRAKGGGFEADPALRDFENVPALRLSEGEAASDIIGRYFGREVLPYAPDAWVDYGATKIGCEISFTRYFYRPERLRESDEIMADLAAAAEESERLRRLVMGGQG